MLVAFMTVNPERVAALLTNILAVGGGFLAGFVLVGVAAYFADRRLTGGKTPPGFHSVLKKIGGVVGALLVAIIVFGSSDGGGGGTGDGTGPTDQSNAGTGSGTGTGTGEAATPTTAPVPPVPPPPVVPAPTEDTVVVTVLSGAAVRDQKFYQVDTDPTPRNLDEVKKLVAARRQGSARPVAIVIRRLKTTDDRNPGVVDLVRLAGDDGMRVIIPPRE